MVPFQQPAAPDSLSGWVRPLALACGLPPDSGCSGVVGRLAAILCVVLLLLLAACGGPRDTPPVPVAQTEVVGKALVQGVADVHRFAKISNGAYFFTGSIAERDAILASYPDFRYEGVGFKRLSVGSGGVAVYRFANLGNGGYFYTASAEERDWVIQNRPDMRFEGSTFEVVDSQTPDAVPVLRLANLVNGAYLYTLSQAEVDAAVATGRWRSEGVAFHAPTLIQCPAGSLRYQGQCVCTTAGQEFDIPGNRCYVPPSCPIGTTRQGPDCLCANGGLFDIASRVCLPPCPAGASRVAGACVCAGNGYFDASANLCRPPCPADATRIGASCVCNRTGYAFDSASSLCLPASCPSDALRLTSGCVCAVTGYLYDAVTNQCRLPNTEFDFQVLSGRPSGCADNQDGCGGGADGSAGAAGDGAGASGADGKLAGALVEVWRPLNGGLRLLGSVPVGPASGMITLRPGNYDGPVLLVFKGTSAGTYFDEALRQLRPFQVGDELNLMIPSLAGARRNYGATVLTDAAFRYALARWGSASAPREQNIAAILTAARIGEAHALVRDVINAQFAQASPALQLADITRMPQVLDLTTPLRSLPDTANGAYAIVLAALSQAAFNFSGVPSPGREFTRQFALDLADGSFDGRNGSQALPGRRVYATPADPIDLGPRLADAIPAAVITVTTLYADSALGQRINPAPPPPSEPVSPTPQTPIGPSSSPGIPTPPSSCGPLVQQIGGTWYCCPIVSTGFSTSVPLYCTLGTTGGLVPAIPF